MLVINGMLVAAWLGTAPSNTSDRDVQKCPQSVGTVLYRNDSQFGCRARRPYRKDKHARSSAPIGRRSWLRDNDSDTDALRREPPGISSNEKGLSDNSLAVYHRNLAKFVAFLEHGAPLQVTYEEVEQFSSWLASGNLAAASRQQVQVTFRAFYRYAKIDRLITVDPLARLESVQSRRKLPTTLSVKAVKALLNAPLRDIWLLLRDKAIMAG